METDEPFSSGRVLIVAAHPDDEVIAAGAQLPRIRDRVHFVHVTNGSPTDPTDARNAGYGSSEEYAAGRREELYRALALAGIAPDRCIEIGLTDQRAPFHMLELIWRLREIFDELQPDYVLTHAYEGGHPDHDTTAFAARTAAHWPEVQVWEFPSYHEGPAGEMLTGEFLPGSSELRIALTPAQQLLKRQMFDCFRSQQHVLELFSLEAETFRPAPVYDFTQPPHPGRLYYEQHDWGITGAGWRELAAAALQPGIETHATHSS